MIEVLDYNLASQLQQVDEEGNLRLFDNCTFKVNNVAYYDYATKRELTSANAKLEALKISKPENIAEYEAKININNQVLALIETFNN